MTTFSAADRRFMARALALSRQGAGWVNPNPMVGAVVVGGGRILGEGYHARAGHPHAEIEAIRAARRRGRSVRGATLYVTLEPCSHFGRTPPCARSVIEAGIRRVVVAERDVNPKVAGQGIAALRRAGLRVEVGCLAAEAKQQNEIYRHWITQRRPLVTLKMSVSLDGKISPPRKKRGRVFYLIGREALQRVHEMRQCYDAILVGIGTMLSDNPQLTTRRKGTPTPHHPLPVILDSRARTPLGAKILKPVAGRKPPLIVVGPRAPKARLLQLQKAGAQLLCVAERKDGLDLGALLTHLAEHEITGLMVEGGSRVATSLWKQGLVDHLEIALAPILLGSRGVPMLTTVSPLTEVFANAQDLEVTACGRDTWITANRIV